MPLMNRAMLLRLSGQMTSVREGSEAERSVIILSPSSFSLFFKKSTSPTYSVIMVKSLMDLSASTVKLQKEKFICDVKIGIAVECLFIWWQSILCVSC